MFAISEVDRESLENGDDFLLEIEVQQMDNPLKAATAKVRYNNNSASHLIEMFSKYVLKHLLNLSVDNFELGKNSWN